VISRLRHKPLGIAALCYLALITTGQPFFAPLLAPYGQDDQDLTHTLSGPSAHHWPRHRSAGPRHPQPAALRRPVTLIGVVISSAIYIAVGVTLAWSPATSAGGSTGWCCAWRSRLRGPVIIVLLVVLAIFPADETAAMVTLGLLRRPRSGPGVRSVTKGCREELYIRAAQASGLRSWTIMRRHVLPRLAGTVIVQLSLFGAAAVLLETGLGFLGVGVQRATWGSLISEASQNLGTQPWLLVPSGFLVITFVLALGLVGDACVTRWPSATTMPAPTAAAPSGGRRLSARARPRRTRPRRVAVRPGPDRRLPGRRRRGSRRHRRRPGRDGGEAVGIVGESGAAKSVTALSILGLLRGGGRIVAAASSSRAPNWSGARAAQPGTGRSHRLDLAGPPSPASIPASAPDRRSPRWCAATPAARAGRRCGGRSSCSHWCACPNPRRWPSGSRISSPAAMASGSASRPRSPATRSC